MNLFTGLGVALGFAIGILGHEYVQHRVAVARGDRTPKLMGRVRLDPKVHYDLLGTVILPALFVFVALFASRPYLPVFGYAKPHALNRSALRQPKRDWILVSLSGPAVSLVIGAATGWLLRGFDVGSGAAELLFWMMLTLFTLGVLELLPLPGMDGGRILGAFLKPSAAMRMEELAPYKALFLLILFVLPPLQDAVVGLVRVVCDAATGGVCS